MISNVWGSGGGGRGDVRERAATLTSGAVITGELDEVWTPVFRVVSGWVGVSLVRHVFALP